MKNLLMIGLLCLNFFAGQKILAQEITKSEPTLTVTLKRDGGFYVYFYASGGTDSNNEYISNIVFVQKSSDVSSKGEIAVAKLQRQFTAKIRDEYESAPSSAYSNTSAGDSDDEKSKLEAEHQNHIDNTKKRGNKSVRIIL